MISAVLDTNILASGALARSGTIAQVLDGVVSGQFQLVLSQEILTELGRTLTKPYFATRLGEGTAALFVARLKAVALVTPLTETVTGIASDAADDAILATALSARANFLVTGDKPLQALREYQGVKIVSPAEFVSALPSDSAAG